MRLLTKVLMVALGFVVGWNLPNLAKKMVPDSFEITVNKAQARTVMVEVDVVVDQLVLSITPRGLEIIRSTVPVTIRGAGAVVSPNGHVITAAHLFNVAESTAIRVYLWNGAVSTATVLYQEPMKDLALLQFDVKASQDPVPYSRLADPRRLMVGQTVFAVGNPLGLDWSVSKGIISALNRDGDNPDEGYNFVQTDTPINPGNSGGPVFNLKGEIVGIVSRGYRAHDGLGFAVESSQIIEFITKFRGLDKTLPAYRWAYWN